MNIKKILNDIIESYVEQLLNDKKIYLEKLYWVPSSPMSLARISLEAGLAFTEFKLALVYGWIKKEGKP